MALLFAACSGGGCRRPGEFPNRPDDDDGIVRCADEKPAHAAVLARGEDEDEDGSLLATCVCVQRAQRSLEARRHAEALDLFDRALELRPDHPEALVGRSQALHRAGRWPEAEEACGYALAILPGNAGLVSLQSTLLAGPPPPAEAEVAALPAASPEPRALKPETETAPTVLDLEGMAAPASTKKAADDPKPAAKKVVPKKVVPKKVVPAAKKVVPKVAAAEDDDLAPCPSSKKEADFERELRAVRKANQPGNGGRAPKARQGAVAPGSMWNSFMSKGERDCKKSLFISFYREQYQRLAKSASATVDTSAYTSDQGMGLSINGGHRPMARPDGIKPPEDFRKPVGTLTQAELNKYNSDNERLLISVHGDIFDVSDRPDKYGSQGPYWEMTGKDMTWGLLIGNDAAEHLDHFYDVFKVPEKDLDRKLQGITSWWAFYEKEYGEPVGRLAPYEEEWLLPEPPEHDTGECSVM